ncbi:hypothetical protein A3A03_01535 [Candidatus Nomurabacteria bacterium RIFCSPLOWO2_01_FULL_40_18]|uniref:Uncharacterized protein n=1 Tax=Candidatus Nomurabacteria bacterium RIFCSPLOWO2_01_FULL_40_18 TaxID=1801773 RepID=A0A1F6XKW5_9BACT|nr:MAG: hypothetical protein A3A03_01535 [Candidatus Nomurabacteria bacterium RIFCSPLOWO2_01_FULL_40_18]
MSQTQYLRMLEREIQKINRRIDQKILQGEAYFKEARDHKLLLRKIRYHNRRSLTQRIIHLFFQKDIKNIYAHA